MENFLEANSLERAFINRSRYCITCANFARLAAPKTLKP
jgi:hypothetical protein